MELTDEERVFKERVLLLHKLHPKLDILMCETLLRTPESRLDELYQQYKDNYPVMEPPFQGEQVLSEVNGVPVVSIQHFDTDPHANNTQTDPDTVLETPFN
jgi:hypothetical protein